MNDNDIIALEQLVEKYPWYSLAHLELYKKFSERGAEDSNAYLEKAAAFVHSRELLFEIAQIHEEPDGISFETEELVDETFENGNEEIKPVDDVVDKRDDVVDNMGDSVNKIVDDPIDDHLDSKPVIESAERRNASVLDYSDDDFFELIPEEGEIVVADNHQYMTGGDYFSRRDMEALELNQDEPIDKFIVEKPSLLRGNTSTAVPVAIDEADKFEDSRFYTETLASIYAEQGLVKMAVDVYAKLILLYPEKSAYFASLVKELKTKHNI